MDDTVAQLRKLLKLAADLRGFAADTSHPHYAAKLLAAAIELESRAETLSGHRYETDPGTESADLHLPIDIRI